MAPSVRKHFFEPELNIESLFIIQFRFNYSCTLSRARLFPNPYYQLRLRFQRPFSNVSGKTTIWTQWSCISDDPLPGRSVLNWNGTSTTLLMTETRPGAGHLCTKRKAKKHQQRIPLKQRARTEGKDTHPHTHTQSSEGKRDCQLLSNWLARAKRIGCSCRGSRSAHAGTHQHETKRIEPESKRKLVSS